MGELASFLARRDDDSVSYGYVEEEQRRQGRREPSRLGSYFCAGPKVAGGHAVLVDPHDIDAIANGMDEVIERTVEQTAAAREHAREFTWRRCAESTLEVYRSALVGH